MPWPSSSIPTANLDAGSDDLSAARADLLSAVQAINNIIAARNGLSGIAGLDSLGKLPAELFSGDIVVPALLDADGAGSGLDADLLDGLDSTAYLLADGTRSVVLDTPTTGMSFVGDTDYASDNSVIWPILLRHTTSDTANAGFGVGLEADLEDASGTTRNVGTIEWAWSDPSAKTSYVDLYTRTANTLTRYLRLREGWVEMNVLGSAPTAPASTHGRVYMKADGLYYRLNSGGEVGPLAPASGGVTDHGALTGLADDDHTQYALADGSRTFTGSIKTGAFALLATQLGGDPSAPSAGDWYIYAKSGGIYAKNSAGTVVGPFGASGLTDHGGLSGLGDNDHPQYGLLQPTGNVAYNDSGGDFDFRWEGDTEQNLLYLNAGTDSVGICHVNGSGTSRLIVYAIGAARKGISSYADDDHAAYYSEVTTNRGLDLDVTGLDGMGLYLRKLTLDTGAATRPAAYIVAGSTDAATGAGDALVVEHSIADGNVFVARTLATLGGYSLNGDSAVDVFAIGRGATTVNPGKTAYDFVCHGDTLDDLLVVSGANDRINMGGNTALSAGVVNIDGVAGVGLYIQTSGTDAALQVVGNNLGIDVTMAGICIGAETQTGQAFYGVRQVDGSGQALAILESSHASDSGPLLYCDHQGTGDFIQAVAGSGPGNRFRVANDGSVINYEANGARTEIGHTASGSTAMSGATVTISNLIPAGAIVRGVTLYVIDAVTGATGIDIGTAANPNAWGDNIPVADGTTTDSTDYVERTQALYPTATSIVLTARGSNFSGGNVRVVVHWEKHFGPTS